MRNSTKAYAKNHKCIRRVASLHGSFGRKMEISGNEAQQLINEMKIRGSSVIDYIFFRKVFKYQIYL